MQYLSTTFSSISRNGAAPDQSTPLALQVWLSLTLLALSGLLLGLALPILIGILLLVSLLFLG